ncbi:hypothetical protein JVT61DRAFT_11664 [Boletus reticuloceps]|uniref:Uncharacterized protein n=1 Tax=Boletus reticuloceps TaxID=495285 RepID=A0A8I3ABI9_9AGAM|nr:hypothetical protein JVT61DRAFT_11664 [Boletus reticuloceps]
MSIPDNFSVHIGSHRICPRREVLCRALKGHQLFKSTSYIYRDHFDEWSYSPNHSRPVNSQPAQQTPDRDSDSTTFEIPLTTFIECLGIFGTANMSSHTNGPKPKKWRREDEVSDGERGDAKGKGRAPSSNRASATHGLEHFFGGGNEKRTSMRLSYAGPGYPLTLLL